MKLPPGPFSYETVGPINRPDGYGHVYILDADGRKIASLWGKPAEKMALADLIIAARDNPPQPKEPPHAPPQPF